MPGEVEKVMRLKKNIEKLEKDIQKDTWSLEEALKKMKKEFGCSSLAEAKDKIKKLESKLETLQNELEDRMTKFTKKWKGYFE